MSDQEPVEDQPVDTAGFTSEDLKDRANLDLFVKDATREMMVRLREEMRSRIGKEFLDAAKLWERVVLSKSTESRKKKPGPKADD